MEKMLEVSVVAKRLNVHHATVLRMVKAGVLDAFKTGPSLSRIRIPESALERHLCNETRNK